MRVLLLNTTAQRGGAAIAASRLMKALQSNGVQTAMMVSRGQEAGPDVIRPVGKIRCQSAFLKERWEIFKSNGYSRKNLFAVDCIYRRGYYGSSDIQRSRYCSSALDQSRIRLPSGA